MLMVNVTGFIEDNFNQVIKVHKTLIHASRNSSKNFPIPEPFWPRKMNGPPVSFHVIYS
jgi:hypothetical protein